MCGCAGSDGCEIVRYRFSVVSGQWSVVSGQWSVVGGQWSVVSGRWSVVGGRLSVVAFQFSVFGGEWAVASFLPRKSTECQGKIALGARRGDGAMPEGMNCDKG